MAQPIRSVLVRGATGGAVYAAVGLVQRSLSLLLLPFYARVLPPDQYGQIALIVASSAILSAVLGFGLETAVLRTAIRLEGQPDERDRFINTLGFFAVVTPTVGSVVAGGIGAGLLGASLPVPVDALLIGFLATGLQTSVTVFVGALLRSEERLRDYAIVTGAYAVTNLAVTVVLVIGLRLGPIGWLAGNLAGSILSLAIGLALLRHRWSRVFDPGELRAALLFGIPLLPHTISHWILGVSDRIVLGAFISAAGVGVYNLAYQLAAAAALIVVAVHQGVMPVYAEAGTQTLVRRDLGRVATFQLYLTVLIGLAVALVGPPLIAILFPPSYAAAGVLIPWIAVGYAFYGLYLIPMDSLSVMIGRTRWLWVPTAIAAAVNLGLNLALVPRYGATAAAIDTALAYGALLIGVVLLRQLGSGPRVPYAVGRMATGVGVALVVGAVATWAVPATNDIASLVARSLFVLFAGLVLFAIEFRFPNGTGTIPERSDIDLGNEVSEFGASRDHFLPVTRA